MCSQCIAQECRLSCETFKKKSPVDMLLSTAEYKGVFKRLLTVAKYGSYKQVLIDVTEKLISDECVNEIPLKLRLQGDCCIYPVPMHWRKKSYRGFNQSENIATILSKKTGIPVLSNTLYKVLETPSQASLARRQRQENVKGVFVVRDTSHLPRTVIVVDDVWTTGSTIGEIAHVLKQNGVEYVIAYTLARRWYNRST